jgi:hypothetical protein
MGVFSCAVGMVGKSFAAHFGDGGFRFVAVDSVSTTDTL